MQEEKRERMARMQNSIRTNEKCRRACEGGKEKQKDEKICAESDNTMEKTN